MSSAVIDKVEAHRLVERLPEGATWDDLMREIYVRETIEKGLQDSRSDRVKAVDEIRAKYNLNQ